MSKEINNVAYYEAGHVLALLLTQISFKYVTIDPEKINGITWIKIPLHLRVIKSEIENQQGIPSFFIANNFNRYLKNDFIKIAGLVTEQIYAGINNKTGDGVDFEVAINMTPHGFSNKLSIKYKDFLLDYTKELLELEINWLRITAIAEALIERKTLSYVQVIEVFIQSSKIYESNKQQLLKIIR
jgi:hypothetical protein